MKDSSILTNNGVNVAQSLELFGDMEMYDETLNDFLSMVQEKLDKLDRYKLASDMPNYAIEVHSLKSDARYLGFTTLADLSYQSEMKSKAGDIMFVQDNHTKIINEAKRVIEVAKQYMGMGGTAKPSNGEPQIYIPTQVVSGTGGNPDNPQKLQTIVTTNTIENSTDPMAQVLSEAVNTQVVPVTQPVVESTPAPIVQPTSIVQPTQTATQPMQTVVQPVQQPVETVVQPTVQYTQQPTDQLVNQQQFAQPSVQPTVNPAPAVEPTIQFFTPASQPVQQAAPEPTIQFFTPDPMSQALASQSPTTAPAQQPASTGPKEGTILVVDDSNLVANFVKKIFDAKYDVIIANDGAKAIELVADPELRSKVKACLLDLNMPNVDGYAVLENFKQTGVFVKMPVAVVSGVEDMASIDKVNNYPIVDILSKPFNERDVQRVVEKCLATYF